MTRALRFRARPAALPPAGFPGLDPSWSRLITVPEPGGTTRTFHLLDSGGDSSGDSSAGTLLCVHGNPTWSYLWRRLLAAPPPGWRVIAIDHLGMGYSERLDQPRTLAERVDDLDRLTAALELTGPVVTVAHDWGGILSLGWALRHRDQVRGVVLTNTAVHQPETSAGPVLIRLAAHPVLNWLSCLRTPLFVRATTALSKPSLPKAVRDAFAKPYCSTGRRAAVAEFVADIPFAAGHPSRAALDEIADELPEWDVPALLLWGPRDPVFGNEHLRDLRERLPRSVVHRYERASHLVVEDAPEYVGAITQWLPTLDGEVPIGGAAPTAPDRPPVLAALAARRADQGIAVAEAGGRSIRWAELSDRVQHTAAGLRELGVEPGDRVALLIPPSIELTVALYAVWQAGAVIVVADKGLGLSGMGRALRSAQVSYVIADTAGLLAARPMRLPGTRIAVRPASAAVRRLAGVHTSLLELERSGVGSSPGPDAAADDEAAVLFTSGATGPAKGVRYRHRQVRAQLALIRDTYRLTADDRIVAAFAPFALYGPALGIASVVPSTDVTKPGTLTAAALAEATATVGGTVVFASPAALRNVLATASALTPTHRSALAGVRLLISAGAPVPASLLQQLRDVLPNAEMHTPYGMTEALPVTDISLSQIVDAGLADGVCVGYALAGVEIDVAALDVLGRPAADLTTKAGVTGELWVRAAHIKDSYDALWMTDQAAAAHPGWHRTGDLGFRDDQDRWWIQGRTAHLIVTADGPLTPVGIEQRVQTALAAEPGWESTTAAAVGVGPVGAQQAVVALTGPAGPLAPAPITELVRQAAGVPVAAVLVRPALPVDIRHNSKIDRAEVAGWAATVLAGR